jgi:predicted flap endonuclease-1-like 5' DNA nuclease
MTEKMFHLRANEVRAESQALMSKLRAERLAASRHRLKPTLVKPHGTKALAAVTKPKPAITSILASRKIQTAVKPSIPSSSALPKVTQQPAETSRPEVAELQILKATTVRKARNAGAVTTAAAIIPSVTAAPSVEAQVAKAKSPRPASRKPAKADKAVNDTQADRAIVEDTLAPVATLQETPVGTEAESANKQSQRPVRKASNDPLSGIPALGPGMIWRLSQVGVRTLGDLAIIEADDLRARLGAVARLVRVESWIDLARLKIGTT